MTDQEAAARNAERRISWGGVSFPVPADWDLSFHDAHRGWTSIRLEDAVEVRLEIEWIPLSAGASSRRVLDGHAALASRMAETAAAAAPLKRVPASWIAYGYRMEDGRSLVTALHVGEEWPVCVFVRLHASERRERRLPSVARRLIEGFRYQAIGLIPWDVFDLSLRVPSRFHLTGTSLLAGAKRMDFACGMRSLLVWRWSLVRRLCAGRPAPVAAAELLNRSRSFPGVRFEAEGDSVRAVRRRAFPLGHAEEIGRWCFRYAVRLEPDAAADALCAAVFQYRHPSDPDWIRDLQMKGG